MTAYAFFVQICREEHRKKHPDESVVFSEFSRKCADRWKTMSEKEKKRFQDMAERDKKRYETEMQDYVPVDDGGGKGGRGKQRRHKDPNAPKRSLSAFFWFCNDERPKIKGANPEFGIGEIAKVLGRLWGEVDPALKNKYKAMADRDKARYEREMAAYKKSGKAPAKGGRMPVQQQQPDDDDDDDDDEDEDE